jgi:hypothetical protein
MLNVTVKFCPVVTLFGALKDEQTELRVDRLTVRRVVAVFCGLFLGSPVDALTCMFCEFGAGVEPDVVIVSVADFGFASYHIGKLYIGTPPEVYPPTKEHVAPTGQSPEFRDIFTPRL